MASEHITDSIKSSVKGALQKVGRRPEAKRISRLMGLTGRPSANVNVGVSNIPVPGSVAVYFGDGADKIYQVTQWLPVLEELHEKEEVLLVFRTLSAFKAAEKFTDLPRIYVRRLTDLMDLYDDNDLKLVIYTNNSRTNFQSLDHPRLVHVHVNHGESDKLSMVSNKAKAYDKVFVAGPAAIKRHEAMLIDFEFNKLEVTGRPQLDINFELELEPSEKFDVMYAPTWEGENEDNNYTSLDKYGVAIVESLLENPSWRVVYKPHPRIQESNTPGVAQAHARILEMIEAANEAGGEHTISEQGNILAMFESTDALITDVSSVGLDYLYLHPGNPLVISDRRSNREILHRDAPVAQACHVVDQDSVKNVGDLLADALTRDGHKDQRIEMRQFYFGDLNRGDSTKRFQDVIQKLIVERQGKLENFRGWHS
ncbi:CDP-glycerol glycerophosphotransferase family protein [Glutamicibacter arilaitensis]|uniref:CDP-glycerol--glycerophosphate glycerophosphotransferase n=1 Tax=Glutamicibacter arilaitensis TaxID=256701 RepID=A0A4Y8U069_9MICC|nr:CDP-glycerol glycerophosphotransferase family protein [Glutamicibacter arilaitensis]TFH57422.1 CDP-glycerol--glycerophosphate glycerophosphotransferase [Glutamicibacter arilaitensis]